MSMEIHGQLLEPGEPKSVSIHAGRVALAGDLTMPRVPQGLVVFAHGSGSSRLSPRNRRVAEELVNGGFGTLLFDLLTREEEYAERATRHLRFDVELLASRLVETIAWIERQPSLARLPLGLFGASTGAAAALIAAARVDVDAVVSRGGRPDLAGEALPRVHAPTLLIVGGNDPQVLELNRTAFRRLQCESSLRIVAGATHLFEEPGALDEVTRLATAWFYEHLGRPPEWRSPHAHP